MKVLRNGSTKVLKDILFEIFCDLQWIIENNVSHRKIKIACKIFINIF